MQNDWKSLFPALRQSPISYLDSASSCQVPQSVIDAVRDYLTSGHGNPHRGMYSFSENAEQIYQNCKTKIADWIHCSPQKLIFTKGTTESINLVANSLREHLTPEHSLLVTQMEHHANLLPWQHLSHLTGAKLNVLPINQSSELVLERLEELLADNCAFFALTHTSNVLGTCNPLTQLIAKARAHGVPTLVDAAQSIGHQAIDVTKLECDYLAFSGHKLYAPTGLGVLYCRQLNELSPLVLGGGIVNRVSDFDYQLVEGVSRFEAGSSNMVGIVGLDAALSFMEQFSLSEITELERELTQQIVHELRNSTFGKQNFDVISHTESTNIVSITSQEFHSHDIATVLAENKIAVRAGHHCAQPCLNALGVKHCVRISLGLYNDTNDVERLFKALSQLPLYLR